MTAPPPPPRNYILARHCPSHTCPWLILTWLGTPVGTYRHRVAAEDYIRTHPSGPNDEERR